MKTLALPVIVSALLASANILHAENPVIVHEWGTFTSLQDENGRAIGGINVDDEPVPWFVCQIAGTSVVPERGADEHTTHASFGLPPYGAGSQFVKGWGTVADPNVTLRLETPVLYIYPPDGQAPASVPPLDVHVDFHGGVLSQFYPYATATGLPVNGIPYFQGPLTSDTTAGLTWKGVQIGATGQAVETTDKVWTTPRETSAPLLQVHAQMPTSGVDGNVTQTEHFLFYRGVGHLDSPLRLASTQGTPSSAFGSYSLEPIFPHTFKGAGWLVEILSDGSCAFTSFPSFAIGEKAAMVLHSFADSSAAPSFSSGNLEKLKASMHDALVKEGLYDDEATAMLKTWELSYFKSPGLRFFYIVPRAWADRVLPLKITGAPVEVTRVMVGRIELISGEQRAALARLSSEAYPDLAGLKKLAQAALVSGKYTDAAKQEFDSGARPLTDLGLTLSASVRDYLSLGRFRDALIVHEQAQHPSDNLARFIKENGLVAR